MSISEPPAPAASPVPAVRSLLTLDQAADYLAISKRSLCRLIARGEFPPPLKIGRASRVDGTDLTTFLEALRRARGDKLGTS